MVIRHSLLLDTISSYRDTHASRHICANAFVNFIRCGKGLPFIQYSNLFCCRRYHCSFSDGEIDSSLQSASPCESFRVCPVWFLPNGSDGTACQVLGLGPALVLSSCVAGRHVPLTIIRNTSRIAAAVDHDMTRNPRPIDKLRLSDSVSAMPSRWQVMSCITTLSPSLSSSSSLFIDESQERVSEQTVSCAISD